MKQTFYKYQGTGNDFVLFDNRDGRYNKLADGSRESEETVRRLCDRRFGVGGDGLMLLSKHPDYDFEMIYFNADGRPSSMCGNGGRCLVKFAADMGLVQTDYRFLAADGPHEASIELDGLVALKMQDVTQIQHEGNDFVLDTGSPHFVHLTTDVMHKDMVRIGREIRNSPAYVKEGINVNFVEQTNQDDEIIVRTYERGVEDETLSCGTGVTAAALVCAHNENGFNRVEVRTKGGHLAVEYDKNGNHYTEIWLIGPAQRVFEGTIEMDV
ncbi:diaminopimelate epimerase [Flaviaesturariibacter aridisoli]|uniref:Diaminopimelate epimerase n=1 Tax=Flaviaesturariibacter aridisoli TaxID=2545761 RepID=A0A4R4E6K0_9BACT|nr:diaminopimelate epimerase [Flaviaesturariibacter aridisoli]TCZ74410.1 diaminopimelate epimerase [Flaviaesturariibacter aridisoli]